MKYIFLSLLAINVAYAGPYENGIEEAKKEILSHIDDKIEEIYFSLKNVNSEGSYEFLNSKLNTYYQLKFYLTIEFEKDIWKYPIVFTY